MKPAFTAPWLYQRMVWGGLLDVAAHVAPSAEKGSSAWMSFKSFAFDHDALLGPAGMGKGLLGLGFGMVTPFVVIGLNCIYGMVASGIREGMA